MHAYKQKSLSILTILSMMGSLVTIPTIAGPTQKVHASAAKGILDNDQVNGVGSFAADTQSGWGQVNLAGETSSVIAVRDDYSKYTNDAVNEANKNPDIDGFLIASDSVSLSKSGSGWNGDTLLNSTSALGSSATYNHAFDYYDVKTMHRTPVNLTIKLNSFHNDLELKSGQHTGTVFSSNKPELAVSGRSFANFQFSLSGVGGKKIPFTISHIGFDQYVKLGNKLAASIRNEQSETNHSQGSYMNTHGVYVSNPTWLASLSGNTVRGEKNVGDTDPKGAFTFVGNNANNFDLTLGNGANPNNPANREIKMNNSSGSGWANPTDKTHTFDFSNMFQMPLWTAESETSIGDSQGSVVNGTSSNSANLNQDKDKDFWVGVHAKTLFPSFAPKARETSATSTSDGIRDYGLRLNGIDKNLSISNAEVVDENGSRSNLFDVKTEDKNDVQTVTAKLKDSAKSSRDFYGHIFTLRAHITPNKAWRDTEEKDGKLKGEFQIRGEYLSDFINLVQNNWASPGAGVTGYVGATKAKSATLSSTSPIVINTYNPVTEKFDETQNIYGGHALPGQKVRVKMMMKVPAAHDRYDGGKLDISGITKQFDDVKNIKYGVGSPNRSGSKVQDLKSIARSLSGSSIAFQFDAKIKDGTKPGSSIKGDAKYSLDQEEQELQPQRDKKGNITGYTYVWPGHPNTEPAKKTSTFKLDTTDPAVPTIYKTAYTYATGLENYAVPAQSVSNNEKISYYVKVDAGDYQHSIGGHYQTFRLTDTPSGNFTPKNFKYPDDVNNPGEATDFRNGGQGIVAPPIEIKSIDKKRQNSKDKPYSTSDTGITGNSGKMNELGEVYGFKKAVIAKDNGSISNQAKLDVKLPGYSGTIKSDKVVLKHGPKMQAGVSVETTEVKDLTDNSTDSKNGYLHPGTGILNPRHRYIVTYRVSGNNSDTSKSLDVNVDTPEHASDVIASSANRININSDGSYDASTQTANGLTFTGKGNANFKGNPRDAFSYKVSAVVPAEGDWSDYYNDNYGRMHFNNYQGKVDANSYLDIPTVATAGGSKSVDHFRMGVQLFKMKTLVVQNDKYKSNNFDNTQTLNPSHYNAIKSNESQNDRQAITHAIMIQMPNYLKIDDAQINSINADPGYDKGWSAIGRARSNILQDLDKSRSIDDNGIIHVDLNSKALDKSYDSVVDYDLSRSNWSDSSANRDAGRKLGLSYLTGEYKGQSVKYHTGSYNDNTPNTNSDWGEPVGGRSKRFNNLDNQDYKDRQTTAGKTYFMEQKWNAKTKYYHDYAKLDHMWTHLDEYLSLNAHSQGNMIDDETGDLGKQEQFSKVYNKDNDKRVKIHLSNIYGYTMLSSKATYSKDGKTLKYKTYGQQLGLAVDNDHKTNFGKVGLPYPKESYYDGSKRETALDPEEQPVVNTIGTHKNTLHMYSGVGNGEERIIENTEDTPAPKNARDLPGGDKNSSVTYDNTNQAAKRDDNTEWKALNVQEFWTKATRDGQKDDAGNTYQKGELMPKSIEHGYYSGTTKNEINGHSVMLTIPRTDHEETLTDTRKTDIQYEPYKKIVIGKTDSLASIDKQGFKLVRVNANQTATNPVKFITYYDFNHDFGSSAEAATRVLRETYELDAPKSLSGKAGNGVMETRKLKVLKFGEVEDTRDERLANYRTNLSNNDELFQNGQTLTANNESLNASYSILRNDTDINNALQSSRKFNGRRNASTNEALGGSQFTGYTYSDGKLNKDAITSNTYKLAQAREAWRPLVPQYRLVVNNFRFNNKVFDQNGDVAFANDGVEYRDYNHNVGGYSYDKNKVTLAGYRNYLRRDLTQGKSYILNLKTTTANEGLMGDPGFGVGYGTSINFDQPIKIYGHRIMEKQYNANKGTGKDQYGSSTDDDIAIEPAISGRTAQDFKNFTKSEKQWMMNNDSDTLSLIGED